MKRNFLNYQYAKFLEITIYKDSFLFIRDLIWWSNYKYSPLLYEATPILFAYFSSLAILNCQHSVSFRFVAAKPSGFVLISLQA